MPLQTAFFLPVLSETLLLPAEHADLLGKSGFFSFQLLQRPFPLLQQFRALFVALVHGLLLFQKLVALPHLPFHDLQFPGVRLASAGIILPCLIDRLYRAVKIVDIVLRGGQIAHLGIDAVRHGGLQPLLGNKGALPEGVPIHLEDLLPKVDAEILGGLSGHVIIEGKRVILVLLSKRALHPVTPSSYLKHQAPAVDAAIPGTVMLPFGQPLLSGILHTVEHGFHKDTEGCLSPAVILTERVEPFPKRVGISADLSKSSNFTRHQSHASKSSPIIALIPNSIIWALSSSGKSCCSISRTNSPFRDIS